MRGHWGKNLVIILALLAAGFFAAYLRFRPFLGQEGVFTDGDTLYEDATGEQIRFAVWDDPAAMPSYINTEAFEGRPAISPDGSLMVFCVGQVGLNADLYMADLINGEPANPRPCAA